MWRIKIFKSRATMNTFLEKRAHKIQWQEIFVNNAFAIEYRLLRRVY